MTASKQRVLPSHALLGGSVLLGWVLHDLFIFANSGRPGHALSLLPGASLLVLLGLISGLCLTRRRPLQLAMLVVLALLSVAPRLVELPIHDLQEWLPRALLLCLLLGAAAAWLSERLDKDEPRSLRIGLAAGVLGCVLVNTYRGAGEIAWPVVLFALLYAFWDWPRVARWRTAGSLFTLLSTAILGGYQILASASDLRTDLGPPPTASTTPAAPNLVLIVLDTVRADRMSSYGHERPTTPEIDAFMERHATRYTQARSAGSFTFPSHASLFTGLLPAEHGAAFMGASAQPLRTDTTTLAERLRDAGYQTGAVISNRAYFFPRLGLDRGFEHYDNRDGGSLRKYVALWQFTGRQLAVGHQPYREAAAISDGAGDWLDERRASEPFFLFINYMDAHGPTIPPAPFDRAFESRAPRRPLHPADGILELLYDRSLFYMDGQVARILHKLEAEGLLENTLLVLTSDHGHSLGERGFHGHGRYLYEELVHVPLFIKPAAGRTRTVETRPMSSTELHDWMLAELGLDSSPATEPITGVPSRSGLTSEWYHLRDRPDSSWAETDLLSWLTGTRKFIAASDGSVEAYDLARDPLEQSALVLTSEEEEAARVRARAWWVAHPLSDVTGEVPREQLDALRDLGYAGEE